MVDLTVKRNGSVIRKFQEKCFFSCVEESKHSVPEFNINVFNTNFLDKKYCNLLTEYHYEDIKEFPLKRKKGLASYLPLLPLGSIRSSFREGNTPLIKAKKYSEKVEIPKLYVKDEGKNPTGTFKDRKSVINVNVALDLRIRHIYSVTSGNAGISLSFYSNPNGIETTHFLINPKRDLILEERFIKLAGGMVERGISKNMKKIFEFGTIPGEDKWNCTPGFDPIGVEGYKVISWEIWDQLGGKTPDVIFVPVGSGGGLYGIHKGFRDLKMLELIDRLPKIFAVQPAESPIVSRALGTKTNRFELEDDDNLNYSVADHLVASFMPSLPLVISALEQSNGQVITVDNEDVQTALRNIMKTEGLIPEPSAATVFAAIEKTKEELLGKSSVAVLTGNGLKYVEEIAHILEVREDSIKPLEYERLLRDDRKVRIIEADKSRIQDILTIQHEMVDEGKYTMFLHKISYEEEIDFFNRLKDNEKIFVAKLNGATIGYCIIVNYMKQIGSSSHIAEIGTFVRKEHREKGLGNHFVSILSEFAKQRGYEKLILEVRASNTRAINLYKQHGFASKYSFKDYYRNGDVNDDRIIMEKET